MQIGLFEAKQKLSALVRMAGNGETVILTDRGIPKAMIVPMPAVTDRARAVDNLMRFGDAHALSLGGQSLKEMIEDGRR